MAVFCLFQDPTYLARNTDKYVIYGYLDTISERRSLLQHLTAPFMIALISLSVNMFTGPIYISFVN